MATDDKGRWGLCVLGRKGKAVVAIIDLYNFGHETHINGWRILARDDDKKLLEADAEFAERMIEQGVFLTPEMF
jgi:hypothetical protein